MRTNVIELLDPELRATYSSMPTLIDPAVDADGARRLRDTRFATLASKASEPAVAYEDLEIPGPRSGPEVMVRVYRPSEGQAPYPAVIWLHGGGFSSGSVRFDDDICMRYVEGVSAIVVSVEYRLLPENPYPAAIEDAYAALKWAADGGESLGIDPTRIAVAGLSAGATIAAGLSLLARDRGELTLACQLLAYASLDDRLETPSAYEFADQRSPHRSLAANQWKAYLGPAASEPPAYAVPMRAASLAGLPSTYIMVGAIEIVRDENIAYAQRLLDAGVPTELHVYPSVFHGFDVVVPDARIAGDAREDQVRALRRALRSQ